MLKKQMDGMTAKKLRIALIVSMALIFVLSGVGFYFVRNLLANYALQVQQDNQTAALSNSDVTRLQELQKQLNDNQVAVKRAQSIVADSQHYQYQNQIINDLSAYAKQAGLGIESFTFDSSTGSTGTTPTAAAGGQAAAVGGNSSAPASDSAVLPLSALGAASSLKPMPANLKAITATITLKKPTGFTSVMNFFHLIELNLTKMQLGSLAFTYDRYSDRPGLTLGPIVVEVYTR